MPGTNRIVGSNLPNHATHPNRPGWGGTSRSNTRPRPCSQQCTYVQLLDGLLERLYTLESDLDRHILY